MASRGSMICRVISGIVHVLKSGCRWIDAPAVYGPRKTLYNRFVRWAAKGVWADIFHALASAGGPPAEVLIDSSAVKAHRWARAVKGGAKQAIGRSRGGRTTKIHALADRLCRPIAFLLTGGQVADCIAADTLLDQMPATEILHGDKGYDSDAVRRRSRTRALRPTSRQRPIGAGSLASRPSSTATATPSSACSAGSRTSAGSPPDTTASPITSSPPSASPLPSATGYKSGP